MTGRGRQVSRIDGDLTDLEALHAVVHAAYSADDPDFPSSRLPELVVAATRPPPSRHLELCLRVDDVPRGRPGDAPHLHLERGRQHPHQRHQRRDGLRAHPGRRHLAPRSGGGGRP